MGDLQTAGCRVLDGVVVGKAIRDDLAGRVARVQQALGRPPALGIVLVGADPASEVYVRNKVRSRRRVRPDACDLIRLPATTWPLDEVLALVRSLDADPAIDGILVTRLPTAMGADAARTGLRDDRSGQGRRRLPARRRRASGVESPRFVPCTPAGILALSSGRQSPIAGRHAVVVGRSDIVGKPMAVLLLHSTPRHDLPFEDAGSRRRVAAEPTSWWPRWGGRAS